VIAGAALGDGDQRFEARIAGESVTRTFVVTIDKSAPAAPVALRLTSATDTGLNNADGITNSLIPVVEGDADADSLVTLMVDGQVVGQSATGSPFRIPAGALDEGPHSATATAEDLAGNFSTASTAFDFEVDRTPPEVPAFDLRPDSDTAPQGDSITTVSRVSLTGQTSPGARVELLESASLVTADGGGVFQFDRVRLKLGSNPLTARAIDLAGNQRDFLTTLTLDNQPPDFDPISPLSVMPGARVEVQLSASDADGDSLTFAIDSEVTLPRGMLAGNVLSFEPTIADVGTYQFTVLASDGKELTPRQATLEVIEDPVVGTRISGRILTTASEPLVGVRVSVGNVEDFTSADGSFELGFGNGALPGDTLRVRRPILW
jgi:hypothetical protein